MSPGYQHQIRKEQTPKTRGCYVSSPHTTMQRRRAASDRVQSLTVLQLKEGLPHHGILPRIQIVIQKTSRTIRNRNWSTNGTAINDGRQIHAVRREAINVDNYVKSELARCRLQCWCKQDGRSMHICDENRALARYTMAEFYH